MKILPDKPRDWGLFCHAVVYRIPPEESVTPEWVEAIRAHCKMRPERLAELMEPPHDRFWHRALLRRAARLRYRQLHGCWPEPGVPLIPTDKGHAKRVAALVNYRKNVAPARRKAERAERREKADEMDSVMEGIALLF